VTGPRPWLAMPLFEVALAVYVVPAVAGVGSEWGYWLLVGWGGWPVMGALVVLRAPWWAALLLNAIPISIGIAALRYRLWDIDRVVSRTVAYGLVTAAVLGVYALAVTTIARLLPVSDALAVAVATLAAAVVFRPLLSRVQGYVDRRFDRAWFAAGREAEAFAVRLTGAIVDAVATDQDAVLACTLAPEAVGVWTGSTR
jgi:hypothetical protein